MFWLGLEKKSNNQLQEACFNSEEAKTEMAAISGRDPSEFKARLQRLKPWQRIGCDGLNAPVPPKNVCSLSVYIHTYIQTYIHTDRHTYIWYWLVCAVCAVYAVFLCSFQCLQTPIAQGRWHAWSHARGCSKWHSVCLHHLPVNFTQTDTRIWFTMLFSWVNPLFRLGHGFKFANC